jgi:hypothetical protein
MVDGMIDAATVIDAQINYGIPSLKSTLKTSNIAGKGTVKYWERDWSTIFCFLDN